MSDVQQRIDQLVKNNRVVLFMKGTAQFPMCGFSGRAIQVLKACGVGDLTTVNVLEGTLGAGDPKDPGRIEFEWSGEKRPLQIKRLHGMSFYRKLEVKEDPVRDGRGAGLGRGEGQAQGEQGREATDHGFLPALL